MIDELKKGDEMLVLGARGGTPLDVYQPFFRNWHNDRARRGIRTKMIFNQEAKETYGKEREATLLTEVKYLPKEASSPGTVNLYKDYVLISLLTDKPVAIRIKNKTIANSFREYFNLLWNQETRTLKGGDEAVEQICSEVIDMGKDLYLIGANGWLFSKYPRVAKAFEEKRMAAGIKRHHLSIEKTRNTFFNKLPNTEARYLPKEFDSPMVIWVFGDKVATVLWDENVISITQNRKIAEDYKKYFNLLWKTAKK
jgi:hypothetical protein